MPSSGIVGSYLTVNEATDNELISRLYKYLITAQHQENKEPNQKMSRRSKQTFYQRHTDGQQAF